MAVLGSRKLTITVDGTDYTSTVTSAKITRSAKDSGDVSFAEAAAGGQDEFSLVLKGFQDPSADTLWDLMWTSAGEEVPVVLHPNGGTVDADHPKFTGTCVVTMPEEVIGGDASSDSSIRWTSEATWVYTARPVRSFS